MAQSIAEAGGGRASVAVGSLPRRLVHTYLGTRRACLVSCERITVGEINTSFFFFFSFFFKSRGGRDHFIFFKAPNSAFPGAQAGTAIYLQGTYSWLPGARHVPLI